MPLSISNSPDGQPRGPENGKAGHTISAYTNGVAKEREAKGKGTAAAVGADGGGPNRKPTSTSVDHGQGIEMSSLAIELSYQIRDEPPARPLHSHWPGNNGWVLWGRILVGPRSDYPLCT